MDRKWLFVIACVFTAMIWPANAYNGKQVNAKAVSVQWRFTKWFYNGSQGACCECSENQEWDGSILVFTIQGAKVAHTDTIYRREQGLAQSAVFDLTGTRIAFYRKGTGPQGPNGAGNCVTVNDGKNHVSIINPDGTGLQDLCDLPGRPGVEQNLDWSVGDWIYYTLPKTPAEAQATGGSGNTNSVKIWKVNAKTKQNLPVAEPTFVCPYWRRFSIDVTATHMGGQIYDYFGCTPAGQLGSNTVYNFPPSNNNFPAAAICSNPGCNTCVSTSGTLTAWYMGGLHDCLYITKVNQNDCNQRVVAGKDCYNLNTDLEPWAGVGDFGIGAEQPGWAVNSDKWVLQEIGWYGHTSTIAQGSNQVVFDWQDQVAIRISNNPKPPASSTGEADGICLNNATGDMWIDDPVNNPLCNKYEDVNGVWHEVPGANTCTPTSVQNAGMKSSGMLSGFFAKPFGRAIQIQAPEGTPWELTIATADGKTLKSIRGQLAGAGIPLSGLGKGVYIVKLSTQGKTVSQHCVLQ
jgi:hypothetical protein